MSQGGNGVKIVSKEEYSRRVEQVSPPSPVGKDCLMAFLSGGAICTLGQALCGLYQSLGLELAQARTGASISLIFLSALLTALGIYDRVAKYAGAGTLVPITGFANSMVSPALEFKCEGFVTGLGAKLFSIAGPVLVFGVSASVVYGLVLFGLSLLTGGAHEAPWKKDLGVPPAPHHPLPRGGGRKEGGGGALGRLL